MKCVKDEDKKSVHMILSLSSDSESSVESFHSKDSQTSYGKWATKRSKAEIGLVDRKVAPITRIKNYKANTLSLSVSPKSNYFDLTQESKEHSLLPGVSFNALTLSQL